MKICKECGKEFEPINKKGIFCSNKCRQKDYRKTVSKILKAAKKINTTDAKTKSESKQVAIKVNAKEVELTAFQIYQRKKLGLK